MAVRLLKLLIFLLLLSSYGSSSSSSSSSSSYKDPHASVEDRVEDLLRRMSLEEKLGQMLQIDRTAANASVIRRFFVGISHTHTSATFSEHGSVFALPLPRIRRNLG
jgi:beta-glucosidase